MNKLLELPSLLPWADWLALVAFFTAWVVYATLAGRHGLSRPSVLSSSNRVRRQWMLQSTYREVRMLDGLVVQNLSASASFFASTTIFIIGGLLAVLGTTEQASDLVREIPFAVRLREVEFLEGACFSCFADGEQLDHGLTACRRQRQKIAGLWHGLLFD